MVVREPGFNKKPAKGGLASLLLYLLDAVQAALLGILTLGITFDELFTRGGVTCVARHLVMLLSTVALRVLDLARGVFQVHAAARIVICQSDIATGE